MNSSNWYRIIREGQEKQIILFPYAGGMSNAFINLDKSNSFPENTRVIMINMPGHDINKDNLISNIDELMEYLFPKVRSLLSIPTILFGYSMGGLVAYRLSVLLGKNKFVRRVIVAASTPPNKIPSDDFDNWILTKEVNYSISKLLTKANVCNDSIYDSLYSYFYPIFEADSKLFYSCYKFSERSNFDAYVLFGDEDKGSNFMKSLEWCRFFRAVKLFRFAGGHMFINNLDNAKLISKLFVE